MKRRDLLAAAAAAAVPFKALAAKEVGGSTYTRGFIFRKETHHAQVPPGKTIVFSPPGHAIGFITAVYLNGVKIEGWGRVTVESGDRVEVQIRPS